MSEHDDGNQELRLPWDLSSGDKMAAQMQQDRETERIVEFFKNLDNPDTTFKHTDFQKHWYEIQKYDFTPEQLTKIIRGVAGGLNQLQDAQLKKDCLSDVMFTFEIWEDQATPQIPQFNQFDLASCLWAFRELDLNPHDDFMDSWYKYADPGKILQNGPEEHRIVRSIVSCAQARLKPSQSFWNAWNPKALEHMPGFSPTQVAFSLWPYARFGEEPEQELLESWYKRFDELISEDPKQFRQLDLVNILGSAATLHAITGKSIYKAIAEKTNPHIQPDLCNTPQLRQIATARLWFDWENDAPVPKPDDRNSRQEKKLRRTFKHYGYKQNPNMQKIEGLNHRPDMSFLYNGRNILMETDGETHFLFEINDITGEKQPAGFTGRTLFMSALIKKFAANAVLLRLPHPLIRQILSQDPFTEKEALEHLLETASKAEPGAYHARLRRPLPNNQTMTEMPILRPLKIASNRPEP